MDFPFMVGDRVTCYGIDAIITGYHEEMLPFTMCVLVNDDVPWSTYLRPDGTDEYYIQAIKKPGLTISPAGPINTNWAVSRLTLPYRCFLGCVKRFLLG